MNVVTVAVDDDEQRSVNPVSEAGPASRIVVAYGFWIFLLSDIVMFSALFAAYAVLVRATAGGPTGAELFNERSVAVETACLLISSYTCGLMSLAVNSYRRFGTYLFAAITLLPGAAFLTLEIREFANMVAHGAAPQRSASPSAFFILVGCHGLHATAGLIWLIVMMAQVAVKGFRPSVQRRTDRDVFLGRQQNAALATGRGVGDRSSGHGPDGSPSGILPAHYHAWAALSDLCTFGHGH